MTRIPRSLTLAVTAAAMLVLPSCARRQTRPKGAPAPAQPLVITNSIGMKLRLIQPGTFLMGAKTSYAGRKLPVRPVTISKPFYIGVYEVTQEQYQRVMGTNPARLKGPNRPVERVSWHDGQEFCRRLSKKEGAVYRLPTSAEWEYACRAGSTTMYCFGDAESELGQYAWYWKNSRLVGLATHDVGKRRPNRWGLYDMHGNVLEWCQDWLPSRDPQGPETDPPGPSHGELRNNRGGSWATDPFACRSGDAGGAEPDVAGDDNGFRVVRLISVSRPAPPIHDTTPHGPPTPVR